MSIDFDSNALQTQQEEEEYDQEDYAREQEVGAFNMDVQNTLATCGIQLYNVVAGEMSSASQFARHDCSF